MALSYTGLLTENLEESKRKWFAYNVGTAGALLHMRLDNNSPDALPDIKTVDEQLFLPGDTVAGLGSISFTQLLDEDLGRGMHRITRAYATPAGNVLVHRYSRVVFPWERTTRTIYIDEHIEVIEQASISGTDIVRAAGAAQVSVGVGAVHTSGATSYSSSASWQNILVAPASSILQLTVAAKLGDSIDARLSFGYEPTVGAGFFVETRLILVAAEFAWAHQTAHTINTDMNLPCEGKLSGLVAGNLTLTAQVFVETGFNTIVQKFGTHRVKLEYRLFRG